jgi:cobalamin biosynthesis Mg chelatase CobN|tara:strand:+ start:9 stop:317 length:309 start_codon:yes stop_codon:yes gene_type:complete
MQLACYGTIEFGYVILPVDALLDFWRNCKSDANEHFEDFDAYHKWYQNEGNHITNPTWPVILSNFDDEILQDGWHRFHAYIELGANEIPAVWYPRSMFSMYN